MPSLVWICEKCGSLWADEESANKCDAKHKTPKAYTVLSWGKFEAFSSQDSRLFPLRIKVEIEPDSQFDGNYATYILERVGPKPV